MTINYNTKMGMTKMIDDSNIMTLSAEGLNVFAREITHEGNVHKVHSVGVGDEFTKSARFRSLLRSLVWSDRVTVELLNDIGFSKADASELGMSIGDLELINPPPREDWNE